MSNLTQLEVHHLLTFPYFRFTVPNNIDANDCIWLGHLVSLEGQHA